MKRQTSCLFFKTVFKKTVKNFSVYSWISTDYRHIAGWHMSLSLKAVCRADVLTLAVVLKVIGSKRDAAGDVLRVEGRH